MLRLRLLGGAVAAATLAADQGLKHWLLDGFDIAGRQPVAVLPFVDLVLAWNKGISYSLFTTGSGGARLLLLGVTLLATLALAVWMWRSRSTVTTAALGLLIGGALGNAVDRARYGAVMDFVWVHAGRFSWYIFNGADVAITVGVAVLLLDSFLRARPAAGASKMPR